jgi:hypothetical protein
MMTLPTILAAALLVGGGACSRSPEHRQAVQQKSVAAATLTMESPVPPVTGTNTIIVILKESDGAPIGDAAVSGELFMPVMESMGRTTVVFHPEGNGRYAGEGALSMAGSWQITVTAKRAGQTLATRTFNLTTRN